MSIAIKETSRDNMTGVELYMLTQSPEIQVIKNLEDGTVLEVKDWCVFEDTKDNGEIAELLSIITPDNKCYSCQSATFKRSFFDIIEVMNGEKFSVKKISGTTKAGRPYVNCCLYIG